METSITDDLIRDATSANVPNTVMADKLGVAESTIRRWKKTRQGTAEREMAVAALRAEGVDTKGIAAAIGIKDDSVYQIEHRIRKEGKNPLLSPKRLKNAVKVYDTFMSGKPIGREERIDPATGEKEVVNPGIYPKCSTIKACADAITDRAFPKVSDQLPASISFTQINLGVLQTTEVDR